MAYIKYKEITKYFYFYKELSKDDLPKYVTDYISPKEEIFACYSTRCDRGVFTDKKILLFDVKPFSGQKQIHTVPLTSVSTIAVLFNGSDGELIIYLDSGYPLNLKFRQLSAEDKTKLRLLYTKISDIIVDNH